MEKPTEASEQEYSVRPNKSQIKRDLAVLSDMGEELSKLSVEQLRALQLPDDLFTAISTVAGMPRKGARKRQFKFITGLLREIDVEPIKDKLARLNNKSAHAHREHHLIERWRDSLLTEGDEALSRLLSDYPAADGQQLRGLMRNANKEIASGQPHKSSKLIYHYLKLLVI